MAKPLTIARKTARQVQRFGRAVLVCILAVVLLLVVASNTATAFNTYQDIFVTLSARPLGMGGAFAALSGPESVFYNPAGLANVRRFHLMHNHSARHFPGSTNYVIHMWFQFGRERSQTHFTRVSLRLTACSEH